MFFVSEIRSTASVVTSPSLPLFKLFSRLPLRQNPVQAAAIALAAIFLF
ncbi:hypothetical protein BN1182_BZ_00200 [Pantoea ananatis]|nr:hypothetical protein BN1182_BZ_00200 [Pantoea ananatis]